MRGKIPGSSSSGSLTSPENGQLQHKGREFQRVGGLSITFKPQTRANVISVECNEPVHIVDIEDAIALGVDTEIDLTTTSRDVLIAIIAQLQATVLEQQRVIERLQRRVAELEGQAKPGGPPRRPGHKPSSGRQPPAASAAGAPQAATPRLRPPAHDTDPSGGARGGELSRLRDAPDWRLGPAHPGSLELLTNHLPVVPVQVTEHVFIARTCPVCRRRRVPTAQLDGAALGRQRLGVNLISRIATLREEGRLPIRSIQWYLRTVHQLRLSVGAIVSAIHQTAQQAQPAVAPILDRIRASPVVHADETGWRQSGANGYVWTFSTPTERYFLRRGRGKAVVDEALGESFSGVLVSDCYAAYHHYDGPKQRCWAHLLRDIHDLVALYPKDTALAQWAAAVHQLYVEARSFTHPQAQRRRTAQLAWERQLLVICQPFLPTLPG